MLDTNVLVGAERRHLLPLYATVEADHTIRVPADLPVGERVMVVRMPSVADLTGDAARRARFAATRAAIAQAIAEGFPRTTPTDEEIVALVKRARRVPRNP